MNRRNIPRMTYSNGEVFPKRLWSADEDAKLTALVEKYNARNWSELAVWMTPRTGKQCRERWVNHLNSNVKKGDWTEEEDRTLIQSHKVPVSQEKSFQLYLRYFLTLLVVFNIAFPFHVIDPGKPMDENCFSTS